MQYRKNVVVLGNTPYKLLFEPSGIDPIGKTVRVGSERFEVVGVFDKRPAAGGFNLGAGRLRRHPLHDVPAHLRPERRSASAGSATFLPIQIAARAARRRQPGRRASPTSSG